MISATFDTKKLIETLQKFPRNIQKNVMVGAVRAGANIIRDEARRKAPKKSGTLAKSIISMQRKAKQGEIKFSVTPSKGGKNSGWYAHFREFGTSFSSASPFMRPAFEQSNNESLESSKKYIAERIPQELMKAKQ